METEKAWVVYNVVQDNRGTFQKFSIAGTDNYSELDQTIQLALKTVAEMNLVPHLVVQVENIISKSDGKIYTDQGNVITYTVPEISKILIK